jgi:hypothetical protein
MLFETFRIEGNLMNTFSPRVREIMFQASSGFCQCSTACTKKITEFHHPLANTSINRQRYPLFIQSAFNCTPINNDCHMVKPKVKISERMAIAYEIYLQELIQKKGL